MPIQQWFWIKVRSIPHTSNQHARPRFLNQSLRGIPVPRPYMKLPLANNKHAGLFAQIRGIALLATTPSLSIDSVAEEPSPPKGVEGQWCWDQIEYVPFHQTFQR